MGLFSTTHIHTSSKTEYVPYEKEMTINEHRAPTDKSVELLNEFEKEAKNNLIDKLEFRDNVLDCDMLFFREGVGMGIDEVDIFLVFKLNGKDYKLNRKVSAFKWREVKQNDNYNRLHWSSNELLALFFNEVCKIIAIEVFEQSPEIVESLQFVE